ADDDSVVVVTTSLKDGEHTIQVRITDVNDKSDMSRILKFTVDNTAPVISNVQVLYPEGMTSAKTGGSVVVTAYVKDDVSGVNPSTITLSSQSLGAMPVSLTLVDDGTGGDSITGDFVYSVTVPIATDSSGAIDYSLSAADVKTNTRTLQSSVVLDNTAPSTNFTLTPAPESGTDIRSGKTYFRRLIMKGTYTDAGGSGVLRAFISVRNDSGSNVNTSPIVLAPEDTVFSSVVELVPGNNTIMLYAVDKAGNPDSTTGVVVYHEPKATKVVDRDGGTINNPDGASAVIPVDAVLNPVEITIVPIDPVEERKPLNKTLTLLNVAHDFGPNGTTFRKPVTVTLPYTEADLDIDQDGVQDVDPTALIVVFWDGGTWRAAGPMTVDTLAKKISVQVNHFTIFDLAQSTATAPTELVAYWSDNPVKYESEKVPAFYYNVPEAGMVSLRIVDMAGDLVYQLIPQKTPVAPNNHPYHSEWRGQNVAGRFAGVGLYVYIFTYTPTSTGKTTVIRKPIGVLK
ncbi:MAG: hypothetical protein GF350_10795, partial [Chitinivibrionales bacterium]|nr:hypothetical protein [Chitinivibrionales bacterium]